MLGVKIKNFTTKEKYTIEELFEAIAEHPFTAGEPDLVMHGATKIITFPPLDRQNQVWIMSFSGNTKAGNKFSIQKMEQAGVGKMVGNMVANDLTGNLFGLGRVFGSHSKECERLVEETWKEINALGL